MNIRIKPLLYTFIVVLILFASVGFVISQKYIPAKQQQIFTDLQKSSINVVEDINNEQKKISFRVEGHHTLSEAVFELNEKLANSQYANYDLSVQNGQESEQLLEGWHYLQYYIYEIMGQKKYTDIPQLTVEFNKLYPHIQLSINMDERYVFVTLINGDNQLHRLLPLETSQVGMWS